MNDKWENHLNIDTNGDFQFPSVMEMLANQ